MQAGSRHEEAIALYGKHLSSYSHAAGQETHLNTFLMDCCCEAYSAVADWEGLQQWLQDCKVLETSALNNVQSVLLGSTSTCLTEPQFQPCTVFTCHFVPVPPWVIQSCNMPALYTPFSVSHCYICCKLAVITAMLHYLCLNSTVLVNNGACTSLLRFIQLYTAQCATPALTGMIYDLNALQGSAPPAVSATNGLLLPAKEHVYDCLAAFDSGKLHEAQHAFDLSVWAEVRNDRGEAVLCPVVVLVP